MSRRVRFVPEGGSLVEVTVRTIQSRFLLRPGLTFNQIVLGILGKAQELYGVRCCCVVFASNHWHALLRVDDAEQLARFMQYVNSNIARKGGKLHQWEHGIWSRRYEAILVSDEEAAQVERLKYLLANGCKEGLVARVEDWPGIHSAGALLHGKPLKGLWFNQTKEWAARNRGEDFDRLKYATEQELVLTALPCWAHLSLEEYRKRVAALVEQIESEARADRKSKGIEPLGVKKILRQDPHQKPKQTKKSPAPAFHAATKAVRNGLREAYALFYAAYREAADKLKAGDRTAQFPEGSFPPALPFMRTCLSMPP